MIFQNQGKFQCIGRMAAPSDESEVAEPSLIANRDYGEEKFYFLINKRASKEKFSDVEGVAAVAAQYVEDYDDMVTSVSKYKGFYIGRYELSGNESQGIVKPNEPFCCAWESGYNSCMMFDNDGVTGGMIYGALWDATLLWLKKSGYEVGLTKDGVSGFGSTGCEDIKLCNSETSIIIDGSQFLSSGQTSYTKSNNIYDLAGNCREWTQERWSTNMKMLRRQLL